jgi:hypothetical protein
MKKRISIVLMLLLMITSLATAADKTIGIGIFYGENITDGYFPKWHSSPNYEWNCITIHPTYGWLLSDVWEVYLEGDLGRYNFKKTNVYSLGVSLMTDYVIVGPFYLEIGCGVSHWTDSPNENIVTKGLVGLIKYGTGAKILLNKDYTAKIGYRFTHSSEVFADDTGANTHGVLFSISKQF